MVKKHIEEGVGVVMVVVLAAAVLMVLVLVVESQTHTHSGQCHWTIGRIYVSKTDKQFETL